MDGKNNKLLIRMVAYNIESIISSMLRPSASAM